MSVAAKAQPGADIYDESIVVDCLNVMSLDDEHITKAREAKLTAMNLTSARSRGDLITCLHNLAEKREAIDARSDALQLALTAGDVREAKRSDKLAIIMGLQDPKPIRDDLIRLRTLKDLGVRVIQLTQNTQNYIGTGCIEPNDGGLSRFGRKVVAEMNRLGIVVDIGHCGPRTSLDAIECSELPVLSSHSNPRALAPSPRNKPDEVFEALAKRNGVMGIASWSPMTYRGNGRRPTFGDVLDCFDHAIRIAGRDHVAIGTDLCEGLYRSEEVWQANHGPQGHSPEVTGWLGDWYGFRTWYAEGLETVTQIPDLAPGLIERGHSAETVRKVLGENFMRLFASVCGD